MSNFKFISDNPDYRHLEDKDRYIKLYEEVGTVPANKEIKWREEWMKYFLPKENSSILELGSHNRPNLLKYAKEGHFIDGVELSQTLINTFKSALQKESPEVKNRINIYKSWIEEFKIDKKYDYVLLTEILEHVIDPIQILKVAKNYLKDNGVIYISSPATHWGNNTHVRGVPKNHLEKWLSESNLSKIELWEEDGRTFCIAKNKVHIKIYGLTRVRNEEKIIVDTLNHLDRFCTGGIFVYDDCSTDNTATICENHPSVKKVIRGNNWDFNRAKAEFENRAVLLEEVKKIASEKDWLVYLDADERIEFDWTNIYKYSEDVIGVKMRLFDFYITPEDIQKPYYERKFIGPEYREILFAFKNLSTLKYEQLDQREVSLGIEGKVIQQGYVKHYGKAISIEEWEKTCEYYSKYFPIYADKWEKRKGKAVHQKSSDFGNELITWQDKDKKGIDLYKLLNQNKTNGKDKLNILLTNHHLLDFTGSEIFTFTIADFLRRNGHKVVVYSKYIDKISQYFQKIEVRVVNNLSEIENEIFDIAHIHHNLTALEVRTHFPNLPMIYLSHGVIPFLEQPPVVDINISKYLAVSEEVFQNLKNNGVPDDKIDIFRNIIDDQKFTSLSKINTIPKKAIILSNKIDLNTEKIIRESCKELNIEVNKFGMKSQIISQDDLPFIINQADIVFTLGRGVIETIFCERVPIVIDYAGGDGIVNPENFKQLSSKNFSGRVNNINFTKDMLIEEIKKYDSASTSLLKKMALNYFSAQSNINFLVNCYKIAIKNFTNNKIDNYGQKIINSIIQTAKETSYFTKIQTLRESNNSIINDQNQLFVESVKKKIKSKLNKIEYKLGPKRTYKVDNISCNEKYDILIPIYNAFEHLERCIQSVINNTETMHSIYLLDDASPDKRVLPLLKSFANNFSNVNLLTTEKNMGFIQNLNRGFNLSSNNVIILNSDTQVTKNWIEKLHTCYSSSKKIGIVSPLSNNATILSVPNMNQSNNLPNGMDVDQFAQLVEESSLRTYPRIPTAVGFCMLISRKVLTEVGLFDTIFGLGYCEENDLCLRARSKGFEIVCCDDTYIHHYGEASFNNISDISSRRFNNHKVLVSRYPNYDKEVLEFCRVNPLREIQERVATSIRKINSYKPHILHVIHNFNADGGTELHTKSIVEGLTNNFNSTVIYPAYLKNKWLDIESTQLSDSFRVTSIAKENCKSDEYFIGFAGDLGNDIVETTFAQFVSGSDFEIIHFQHLADWSTLLLPLIAKRLGKKIVISLHDYYLLCPEYNLILPDMTKKCGKNRVNENDAQCQYCLSAKRISKNDKNPILISKYIQERNEIINQIFEAADAIVAPSNFVKDLFIQNFKELIERKIFVIPHGVNVPKRKKIKKQSNNFRVAFIGNAIDRKGIKVLLEAAYLLKSKPIKIEIVGSVPPIYQNIINELKIKMHGNYKIKDLPSILSEIDLVIIPSIWDETFALTLSEVQAIGIPVIASKVGGIAERIIEGETGFLVLPANSLELSKKIIELSMNRYLLKKVEDNLSNINIKTLQENIQDYNLLYTSLLKKEEIKQELFLDSINTFPGEILSTSIITLTYNQINYTQKFIDSIFANTKNFELIIVDNNSTDGTREYLNELRNKYQNIKIILNDENLGFPKAVNQALNIAKGKFIVLTNNDIIVTENWLEKFISISKSDNKIGIVGPISNFVSGVQIDKNAKYNSIEEMHEYSNKISTQNKGKIKYFPRVAFLCTLIKRELIDKIGGLDERFSPGNFEDDDFCLRAQLAGYKTIIAEDVFIHHFGSVSFMANGENEYAKRLETNKNIFIKKWGTDPEGVWLRGEKVNKREVRFPINCDKFIESFEQALINIEEEDYDLALNNLKIAIESFDNSNRKGYDNITKTELLNLAGSVSLAKNDIEIARDYFEKELNINPNSSTACYGLGEIFNHLEMFENAKSMYEWAVANDINNQNAKKRLAEINIKLNLPVEHNSLIEENIE